MFLYGMMSRCTVGEALKRDSSDRLSFFSVVDLFMVIAPGLTGVMVSLECTAGWPTFLNITGTISII